jgi:hypothetical protein
MNGDWHESSGLTTVFYCLKYYYVAETMGYAYEDSKCFVPIMATFLFSVAASY